MIFPKPRLKTLAIAAVAAAAALPLSTFGAPDAAAQEASITVRAGPAYDGYYYDDYYYEPGYRTRYSYDDGPVVVDRVYRNDRDNLRTDRRVRRFIMRQREERAGGEN